MFRLNVKIKNFMFKIIFFFYFQYNSSTCFTLNIVHSKHLVNNSSDRTFFEGTDNRLFLLNQIWNYLSNVGLKFLDLLIFLRHHEDRY